MALAFVGWFNSSAQSGHSERRSKRQAARAERQPLPLIRPRTQAGQASAVVLSAPEFGDAEVPPVRAEEFADKEIDKKKLRRNRRWRKTQAATKTLEQTVTQGNENSSNRAVPVRTASVTRSMEPVPPGEVAEQLIKPEMTAARPVGTDSSEDSTLEKPTATLTAQTRPHIAWNGSEVDLRELLWGDKDAAEAGDSVVAIRSTEVERHLGGRFEALLPPSDPEIEDEPVPAKQPVRTAEDFRGPTPESDSTVVREPWTDADSAPATRNVANGQMSVPTAGSQHCLQCNTLHTSGGSSLAPYFNRAAAYGNGPTELDDIPTRELPEDFQPWWMGSFYEPMFKDEAMPVGVDNLVLSALQFAPQVLAVKVDPQIRCQTVIEEQAQFDWTSFIDTTWDDTSDPVGNDLTTGGSPRFRDNRFDSTAGLRRRTFSGGEWEISQQFGLQDNNSTFFTPDDQSTTRFAINFTQPLMRESGRVVNTSRIVLARLETDTAKNDTVEAIQNHLLEVSRSYWELHRARAVRLQKARLLARAAQILDILEGRAAVDSVRRQILRAQAAVASRRSETIRAIMAVRNAESQLRRLVNAPDLIQDLGRELIPADQPNSTHEPLSMGGSVTIALQNRPDIARSLRDIRAASVRQGVAKQNLLPRLDLLLGAYVAGLDGDYDVADSWRQQFTEGEPGYSIGLNFELPIGNRAAQARARRSQLQVYRAIQEFRSTVENGITEVELAVRENETSRRELLSRYQSMVSADTEATYLYDRWRMLPGDDRSTSTLLEDLLDSQDRVSDEEFDFVTAQVNYMLASVNLKRVTGTLLQHTTYGSAPLRQRTVPAPPSSAPASRRSAPAPAPRANPAPNAKASANHSDGKTSQTADAEPARQPFNRLRERVSETLRKPFSKTRREPFQPSRQTAPPAQARNPIKVREPFTQPTYDPITLPEAQAPKGKIQEPFSQAVSKPRPASATKLLSNTAANDEPPIVWTEPFDLPKELQ